jgi:hypothetical protein
MRAKAKTTNAKTRSAPESAETTTTTKTPKAKRYKYRMKNRPEGVGSIGKLTDELEEEICKLIRGQMTLTDACAWVGINRTCVWEWRTKGQAHPESRYGQFERAIEKAYMVAKAYLIRGVAQHPDVRGKLFILKNRYPDEFRDRIVQEMSGPNGAAMPLQVTVNPFEIKIVMAGEPEAFRTIPLERGLQGLN